MSAEEFTSEILDIEDLKPDTESDTIKLRDKTSADRASVREALYDSKQADEMAKAGLATLLSMQNAGGGYSWFDGGKPSPYLSTIVTRGLILASQSGMDTKNAIDSARDYLAEELKSEMEAVENYKEYQQQLKLVQRAQVKLR